MIPALWLWLACGSPAPAPNPELAAMKQALEAWERGAAELEAGRPGAAVTAFRAAQQARPRDVLLRGWLAKALAEDGDLSGAIDELAVALRAHPNEPLLRYQRAAYLARAGRADEAAAELRVALEGGARPAREVLEDPDFRPLLSHEAFAFLPKDTLGVSVNITEGPVFWGSELVLTLRVAGAGGAPLTITSEAASGPARLVRVIDDEQQTTDGVHRVLSWVFRVEGAGALALGPLTVEAGGRSARVDAVRVVTAAPPGKDAPADLPAVRLPVATEPREAPAAWREGAWLWVSAGPASVVKLEPELPADRAVRFERRAGGRTTAVLWRWPAPKPAVVVRISEGGRERFAETVAAGE